MVLDFTVPDIYPHLASYNPHMNPAGEAISRAEAPNAGPYDPYPNIANYLHLYENKPQVVVPPTACTCGHAAAAAASKH